MRYTMKLYTAENPSNVDSPVEQNLDQDNNNPDIKPSKQPMPVNAAPLNATEIEKQKHVTTPDNVSSIRSQLDNIL